MSSPSAERKLRNAEKARIRYYLKKGFDETQVPPRRERQTGSTVSQYNRTYYLKNKEKIKARKLERRKNQPPPSPEKDGSDVDTDVESEEDLE